jgi:molybdenum cofactor biosynthesis enzyme MoaA
MLKDFLGAHLEEPRNEIEPPRTFLKLGEITSILDNYDFKSVILEGQEASLDPMLPILSEILHKRYSSRNVLMTNAQKLIDMRHIDSVEVGLKSITDSIHLHYTGVSNYQILENTARLHKSGKNMFVESVLIPDYIDIDEIELISRYIANLDKDIRLILLPYFKSGSNPWRRPTPCEMEEAADVARKHLNNVLFFRGDEELKYEVMSAFPVETDLLLDSEIVPERMLAAAGRDS